MALFVAFLLSALFCTALAHPRIPLRPLDHPGARSLHKHPTPRSGGLGIALALFIVGMGFAPQMSLMLIALLLPLFIVALIDDMSGNLNPLIRLLGQGISIALILAVFGLPTVLYPAWLWTGVLWLAMLWLVNLYNFMDGLDGLAAIQAIIGFSGLAALAMLVGDTALALAQLLVVASVLGFMLLNRPPARLFLGDVGSTLLGALVAMSILYAWNDDVTPLPSLLLCWAPFLTDATLTLLKRLLRGEKLWQAHRQHGYQQLVLRGCSVQCVLGLYASFMVLSAALAYVSLSQPWLGWSALVGMVVMQGWLQQHYAS